MKFSNCCVVKKHDTHKNKRERKPNMKVLKSSLLYREMKKGDIKKNSACYNDELADIIIEKYNTNK